MQFEQRFSYLLAEKFVIFEIGLYVQERDKTARTRPSALSYIVDSLTDSSGAERVSNCSDVIKFTVRQKLENTLNRCD
jgi:hypothetical protein